MINPGNNPTRRLLPEQDADKNADSMMPVNRGNSNKNRVEALPKSRKQRRLEATGVLPVADMQSVNLDDARLRAKAKRFSLMVCNDTSLYHDNFSSFAIPEQEAKALKKSKSPKDKWVDADMDIHAFNARIDLLLEKFLRQENGGEKG